MSKVQCHYIRRKPHGTDLRGYEPIELLEPVDLRERARERKREREGERERERERERKKERGRER